MANQLSDSQADQPARPLVSVSVLNRNGRRQVERCFPAVLAMDYPNYEVVFLDDASDDDGGIELAKELAGRSSVPCSFVEMKERAGYSGARNAATAGAKGKYLWMLNNDIKPDAHCLAKLVDFMEQHQETVLCGPVVLDMEDPNRIVGSGALMGLIRYRRVYRGAPREPNGFTYVSYVRGDVMFVRSRVWRQLGGFDESVKIYLDDSDFGQRCWNAGWKVAMQHDCRVRHWDISTKDPVYWRWRFGYSAPGFIRGMVRNYPLRALIVAAPAYMVFTALKAFKNALFKLDPRILADGAVALTRTVCGLRESVRQRRRLRESGIVPRGLFLHL